MKTVTGSGWWRVIATPLIALVVMLGYVVYAHVGPASRVHHVGSAAPVPTRLSAGDLLLAATAAKKGIHLEFDGVTGGASANHTNHALIKSFSWGITDNVQISGNSVGGAKPVVGNITLTKVTDQYSKGFLRDELIGAHAIHAILYFTNVNASGVAFDDLEIDLTDAFVTNFSMKSSGDTPVETISLLVTGFTIKAHISGSQTVTYNVLTDTTT